MRDSNQEQAEVLNPAWLFCGVRLELGAPTARFPGLFRAGELGHDAACELESLPQVVDGILCRIIVPGGRHAR
jgi:hypothetical protein